MRARTNSRATTFTGKTLKSSRNGSYVSELLYGLSAASLFLSGDLSKPKMPKEGIASDWKAVGNDLADAMKRHG